MMPLLRLVANRVPYLRGGLAFEGAAVVVPLGEIDATRFARLLEDPAIDAMIGDGATWLSLSDARGDAHAVVAAMMERTVAAAEQSAALVAREDELARREAAVQAREDDLAAATMLLGEQTEALAAQRIELERSRPDDDADPLSGATTGTPAPVAADQRAAATVPAKPRRAKPKTRTE